MTNIQVAERIIESDQIRGDQRIVLVTGLGYDLLSEEVNQIKKVVEEYLIARGYSKVIHKPIKGGDGIEAIAYERETTDFRKEPFLIDNGGQICNGLPVLKIVVRDINGLNKYLYDSIRTLLGHFGINEAGGGNSGPSVEGTEIYELRRCSLEDYMKYHGEEGAV